MNAKLLCALAAAVTVSIASTALAEPRKPAGVYIHLTPENVRHGSVRELQALLAMPIYSGIAAGIRWSDLEKGSPPNGITPIDCSDPVCTWTSLDTVFEIAASQPSKTIQLIITPGFDTPDWMKAELEPCDALFLAGAPTRSPSCGSVKFINFPEQSHVQADPPGSNNYVLPLPWSMKYQAAWHDFLKALAQRIQSYPNANQLVAIAIAGPNAGSDEMILPTSLNGFNGKFSTTQVGGLAADDGWAKLIDNYDRDKKHTQYADHSNAIFVDAWKTAIGHFETTFSGLTIILGPDAGNYMPTFGLTTVSNTSQLYRADCATVQAQHPEYVVSCEAKVEVIAALLAATGKNQKATQVGGMTAASDLEPGNIGVAGSKILTARYPYRSLQPYWPGQQAIAGAEFDHAVSEPNDNVGCPTNQHCNPEPDPETAAARVLSVLFHHTKLDSDASWQETVDYLDIPLKDAKYIQEKSCSAPSGETPLLRQIDQANLDLRYLAGVLPARQMSTQCPSQPGKSCHTPQSCCVMNGGTFVNGHCSS